MSNDQTNIEPGQTQFYDSSMDRKPVSGVQPHLTEWQRDSLCHYIRQLADRMLLAHWTFGLVHGVPDDETAWASVKVVSNINFAHLWVCEGFFGLSVFRQREAMVHEMIHVLQHQVTIGVNEDLVKWMGQNAYEIFYAGFSRQVEHQVDHLTAVFAQFMPLPPWAGIPPEIYTFGDRAMIEKYRKEV